MNESMPVSTSGALTLDPASSSEQDKNTPISKASDVKALTWIPEHTEFTEETEARASGASFASKTRSVQALEPTPKPKPKPKAIIVWDDNYRGAMGCFGVLKNTSGQKIAFVKSALTKEKALKRIQTYCCVSKKQEGKETKKLVKWAQRDFDNEKQFFKRHSTQVPFIVNEISDQILGLYDPILEYSLGKNAAEYPVVLTEHIRQHWIIEELGQVNLYDRISTEMSVDLMVSYIHQLCIMLDFLDQHQICHHDLKPANILCVNDQLKLIDFGRWLPIENWTVHTDYKEDAVGTLVYASPECLIAFFLEKPWQCHKADVWSVGIIVLFIVGYAKVISDDSFDRFSDSLPSYGREDQPGFIRDYLANEIDSFKRKIKKPIKRKIHSLKKNEVANKVAIDNLTKKRRLLQFTKRLLDININMRSSGQQALGDFRCNFIDKVDKVGESTKKTLAA